MKINFVCVCVHRGELFQCAFVAVHEGQILILFVSIAAQFSIMEFLANALNNEKNTEELHSHDK